MWCATTQICGFNRIDALKGISNLGQSQTIKAVAAIGGSTSDHIAWVHVLDLKISRHTIAATLAGYLNAGWQLHRLHVLRYFCSEKLSDFWQRLVSTRIPRTLKMCARYAAIAH